MNTVQVSSPAFTTTHWSVVLAAGHEESPQADEALEALCRTYWPPLYIFLRRRGYTAHDAEDLTQAFFERLLEKNYLRAVDRSKGKFRSFLLATLQHFIANHHRDGRTQKRGGLFRFISLSHESVEAQYSHSVFADLSAERSFERQWAMTLLEQVVCRLRDEFAAAEKAAMFDVLKIFLTGDKPPGGYAQLAVDLGMTEAALKMAVSRLRKRYGELLRAELANTLSDPAEIEDELRALFAALN